MWTVLDLLMLSIKLIIKWWPFYDSIFSHPTYVNVITVYISSFWNVRLYFRTEIEANVLGTFEQNSNNKNKQL